MNFSLCFDFCGNCGTIILCTYQTKVKQVKNENRNHRKPIAQQPGTDL